MARFQLKLRRVTEVTVFFEHDGDVKSVRDQVGANLDDFIQMGEIDVDATKIVSLKKAPLADPYNLFEIIAFADLVVRKLEGYSVDIEQTVNDLADEGHIPWGYHQAPQAFFDRIDAKVAPCDDCDIWTPVIHLHNGMCEGCRPSEVD